MSETQALFATLRETADASTAEAIERLIKSGADHNLARINVLAFAAARGISPRAFLLDDLWRLWACTCRQQQHKRERIE